MDACCNVVYAFGAMPYGIEASHSGEQGLCGADVGCSLFPLDVLLAGLQGHAVAQFAVLVFRPADDAARHLSLVFVACGKVGGRRTSVEHGCSEALSGAEYDVCSPFARRCQQRKAEDVGGNGYFASTLVGFLDQFAIVFHISVGIGVLQNAGEYVGGEIGFLAAAHA